MSKFLIVIIVTLVVAIVPPVIFVFVRNTTKRHRQEIVRDLSAVFNLPNAEDDSLIPSFEFVKYKYFLKRAGPGEQESGIDFTIKSWFLGLLPLFLILIISGYFVFDFVFDVFIAIFPNCLVTASNLCVNVGNLKPEGTLPLWIYGLCASFAGGYVFMLRSFFRAVNNFDLSPVSFVGAFNNLAVGLVGSAILIQTLINPLSTIDSSYRPAVVLAIVLGFAIGYFPESATRTLLWRSDLGNFKKENKDVYKFSLTTPIEIIDGIDTEIRDRLSDYHIRSTQNLAAANPLMLFVETPYGVYQIMDWVAQAQLCCSVGPTALTKLSPLGIRTLFDLERAALDPACVDDAYLDAIGHIILENGSKNNTQIINKNTIICNIQVRLDDPHVHRLRQIYIKIGTRLGPANRRFNQAG